MLYFLYYIVGWLITPLLPLHVFLRKRKGKEDANRLYERYGVSFRLKPKAPLIWVHAASVGEMRSVLRLITQLVDDGFSVLLTTTTKTSAEMANNDLPTGAFHQYAPFDTPLFIRRFFNHWQPSVILVVESELWPVTLSQAKRRSIPVILVNGRMSKKSEKRWQKFPSLINAMLNCITLGLAQTEEDSERYRGLGLETVTTTGNLKLDTEALKVNQNLFNKISQAIDRRPRWSATSTHDGEESAIIDVHLKTKKKHPTFVTLLAPRHPERADKIITLCESFGLKTARCDDDIEKLTNADIILFDKIGELGTIYQLTSLAFIGGSLVPNGGHNPIEALQLRALVFHGPNIENFEEIYELLDQNDIAIKVSSSTELSKKVRYYLKNETKIKNVIEQQQVILSRIKGPFKNVINALDPLLKRVKEENKKQLELSLSGELKETSHQITLKPINVGKKLLITPAFWAKKHSWLAVILLPISLLWGKLASLRMNEVPDTHLLIPTLCVGNFTLGGAGKTPFVIHLVAILKKMGFRPAIISRAYRCSVSEPTWVDLSVHNSKDVGDESLLLAQHAPTLVVRDRRSVVDHVDIDKYDIVVLDDGFQSSGLRRDLNLIVVNGSNAVSNGYVFPSGPLRAPLSTQVNHADALVVIAKNETATPIIRKIATMGRPVFHTETIFRLEEALEIDKVPPQPIKYLAFAGIGHPQKFFASLESLTLEAQKTIGFPDHHPFSESEARYLLLYARSNNLSLITTEKDFMRLQGVPQTARDDLRRKSQQLSLSHKVTEMQKFEKFLMDKLQHIKREIHDRAKG